MQINLFGIEANEDDIHRVLEFISKYRDKEKNEICLALTLMDENIRSWYAHFNRLFSKEIARQISGKTFGETYDVSTKIIEFINRKEAIDRAKESVDYLVNIYLDYKNNRKTQVKGIDIDLLKKIAESITMFIVLQKERKNVGLTIPYKNTNGRYLRKTLSKLSINYQTFVMKYISRLEICKTI